MFPDSFQEMSLVLVVMVERVFISEVVGGGGGEGGVFVKPPPE